MANTVAEKAPSSLAASKFSPRAVLTPPSSITYQNFKELETSFNECLGQNKTEIILDLKEVSYLDSEGLELLVRMHEELRQRGGALKIIGLEPLCQDILKATRLINVFLVYEDMQMALKDSL